MIDDLASRAAFTVAAVVVLTAGLGLVGLLGGDAVGRTSRELAAHLARALDLLETIDAEARFPAGEGAFALPETLAGSPYHVEVRSGEVRVVSGGAVAVAAMRAHVHPFAPDVTVRDPADLEVRDRAALVVGPADPFVVVRSARWGASAGAYHTFVYLPR